MNTATAKPITPAAQTRGEEAACEMFRYLDDDFRPQLERAKAIAATISIVDAFGAANRISASTLADAVVHILRQAMDELDERNDAMIAAQRGAA